MMARGNDPSTLRSGAQRPATLHSGLACCGGFVLRFESLNEPGRRLEFPCDPHGRVDLDALGEVDRSNYLFARAVLGRGFGAPVVLDCRQAQHER